jgi:hypothetical protein
MSNSIKEDKILGHAFLYLSAKYLNQQDLIQKLVQVNLDKELYNKFKTDNLESVVAEAMMEKQKEVLVSSESKPVVKEQKKADKPASEVNFASFF